MNAAEDPPECSRVGHGTGTLLLLALGAIVVVGVAVVAFAFAEGRLSGGPYPFFWPWFPFGILFLFVLVVFALRGAFWGPWGGRRGFGRYGDPARDILRRRYAAGELPQEQYREMLRVLEESP